jgi:AP-3 complex subunit delta-1
MLYPLPPPPSFAFHVVEVMSSPRYHLKRMSEHSFRRTSLTFAHRARIPRGSDGILNGYRRSRPDSQRHPQSKSPTPHPQCIADPALQDLLSPHAHLPPIALAGLADIVTPSLARDVYADVGVLLTHSRAHVRKRAVLAMFKIFEQYPEALRTGFTRLRDRLVDDDPGMWRRWVKDWS